MASQTVTIRLLPEERDVYTEFKEIVSKKQHSDVCYVLAMLMKAYTQAVNSSPDPADPVTLKFLRQSVQINMGCTFQYYTKKARRTPTDPFTIITDKHNLLPEVTNQYPQLTKEAREFWLREFIAEGIIPKPAIPPSKKPENTITSKLKHLRSIVKQLFAKLLTRGSTGSTGRGS
jgi:hypothetical protein